MIARAYFFVERKSRELRFAGVEPTKISPNKPITTGSLGLPKQSYIKIERNGKLIQYNRITTIIVPLQIYDYIYEESFVAFYYECLQITL